ncbi:MAG: zinc ABC transporter substrate-binding protein [Gemmatimonadota bacterium]|nr:MAG: zinc ABC transporter substrate-binding protein [Gemmatimonadota bacterium]
MVGRIGVLPLFGASCLSLFLTQPAALCHLHAQTDAPIPVAVSISPQKYFVERIAGERASVLVLVEPGRSPTTFEPGPRQMAQLAGTRIYFRIGVPFESVWLDRFRAVNPSMGLVDTHAGVARRTLDSGRSVELSCEDAGVPDPHIWIDPILVKVVARNILDAIVQVDPQRREAYEVNYEALVDDLDRLDREIRALLGPVRSRAFIAYHSAWGYFADRYGLNQIVIESQGKEPGAKAMAEIMRVAVEEAVNLVVVQQQFSVRSAQSVADALGAEVLQLDPLAEDWLDNMRHIAQSMYLALERQ